MAESVETWTFAAERLFEFATRVFQHDGVPESDARQAADVLIASDLRGIDSHGVARLHLYHQMLDLGRFNPRPRISIVRETPATATVDGDNGMGLVVGPKANVIAMDKAETVGAGWVAVRNTNHFGIAGYYPRQALKRDMIGWAMTNASKLIAPVWSSERMLGTNPIAIAFPAKHEPPIVIDMATSAVAYGKIEIALRKGVPIPKGWALDAEGAETTDAERVADGGSLLPLGGDRDHGGHKGYCLASMVDILCGVLGGAGWGPFAPSFAVQQEPPVRAVGLGIGHFFGALRIDGFIDPDEFKTQVDDWIRVFRSAEPAPGTAGPVVPGDPEHFYFEMRSEEGIPLVQAVVDDLRELSRKTGVPLD